MIVSDSCLDFLSRFALGLSEDERAAFGQLIPSFVRARLFSRIGLQFSGDCHFTDAEMEFLKTLATACNDVCHPSVYSHGELYAIMKPTRLCNLRCHYCAAWREGQGNVMTFEVLARATVETLRIAGLSSVHFVWHGGEPTLISHNFYRKALWLQDHFNSNGVTITNSLQTNATLLTDEWLDFFQEHRFSVGVSIDGPQELHDAKRKDAKGNATWSQVSAAIKKLQTRKISVGALLVIGNDTVSFAAHNLLSSLVDTGIKKVAFLNSLPRNDLLANGRQDTIENYLPMETYVTFLCELYDAWDAGYRDKLQIREFDSLESNIKLRAARLCVHQGRCMGRFLTIDPNGDVFACDKFVGDSDYRFGNLIEEPLSSLLKNSSTLLRAADVADRWSDAFETGCIYGHVCKGGCPHDAYVRRKLGIQNSLCCGLAPLIARIVKSEQCI